MAGLYHVVVLHFDLDRCSLVLVVLMKIMLATICLNEMEWLPRLYEQHKNWPGLVKWVFVEAADVTYMKQNPSLVRDWGLSTDGTTGQLLTFHENDPKIHYIPHGFTSHPTDPAQGKCQARNRYLEIADRVQPDWIVVIDADEFYTYEGQKDVTLLCQQSQDAMKHLGIRIRQRHIWRPVDGLPLLDQEVVGGYWSVPHTRVWKYVPGMRYSQSHNWPNDNEGRMDRLTLRTDQILNDIYSPLQCVHMGYASNPTTRAAKHRYYTARGEGNEAGRLGRLRRMYVDCRKAWEEWQPGRPLPHGAEIIPYQGPQPEVLV